MKSQALKINLFNYLDYRTYLKDYYQAFKKSRAGFSFRTFSKRAGFTSPNFFQLVMEAKRNLTEESLVPFMKGLGFNKQEQEFFRNLVFFNQAKAHEVRDAYYQKLLQSKKFSQLKPIEKNQYDYCSGWYHSVVRELITVKDFDGTPEWLVGRISPAISVAQARGSLELLETIGFIKKTDQGHWRQSSPLLSTGNEVTSLSLFNYHLNMLDLTKEVLHHVPAAQRDISSMTLGIKKENLPMLKKKVQEFRQEILKLVSTDTSPDEVVQLNMQLFPLTKNAGEKL